MEKNFPDLFSDKLPEIIYLDTSFMISVLFRNQTYHIQSLKFIERLQEEQPIIIFSELIKPEVWCATVSICIRNDFGRSVRIQKVLRDNPLVIRRYHKITKKVYDDFLELCKGFTHWAFIPVDENILKKALELMGRFSLGSYDAIHIATMLAWNVGDIACFDQGIENLPYFDKRIRIWTVDGYKRFKARFKI